MFWHFLEMSICYEDREKDDEFLLSFLLPLGVSVSAEFKFSNLLGI